MSAETFRFDIELGLRDPAGCAHKSPANLQEAPVTLEIDHSFKQLAFGFHGHHESRFHVIVATAFWKQFTMWDLSLDGTSVIQVRWSGWNRICDRTIQSVPCIHLDEFLVEVITGRDHFGRNFVILRRRAIPVDGFEEFHVTLGPCGLTLTRLVPHDCTCKTCIIPAKSPRPGPFPPCRL